LQLLPGRQDLLLHCRVFLFPHSQVCHHHAKGSPEGSHSRGGSPSPGHGGFGRQLLKKLCSLHLQHHHYPSPSLFVSVYLFFLGITWMAPPSSSSRASATPSL